MLAAVLRLSDQNSIRTWFPRIAVHSVSFAGRSRIKRARDYRHVDPSSEISLIRCLPRFEIFTSQEWARAASVCNGRVELFPMHMADNEY